VVVELTTYLPSAPPQPRTGVDAGEKTVDPPPPELGFPAPPAPPAVTSRLQPLHSRPVFSSSSLVDQGLADRPITLPPEAPWTGILLAGNGHGDPNWSAVASATGLG
jgi:hypothetical protein